MMAERPERSLSPSDREFHLPSGVYDLACVYLALVFLVGCAANGSVTALFVARKKVEQRPQPSSLILSGMWRKESLIVLKQYFFYFIISGHFIL